MCLVKQDTYCSCIDYFCVHMTALVSINNQFKTDSKCLSLANMTERLHEANLNVLTKNPRIDRMTSY